jgi:nicotinamidase-related amidase
MASTPPVTAAIRDQFGDHLLTPNNSALAVIDYQPSQLAGVRSMDRDLLLKNVVSMAKVAKLFGLPIVHSTINVKTGRGQPRFHRWPRCSRTTRPSTERRPTHGKTLTSSTRFARPGGGS